MRTDSNEPINPIAEYGNVGGYGLTKREYMATEIFSGLMNSKASIDIRDEDKFTCALHAVKYADALIRALNKTSIEP